MAFREVTTNDVKEVLRVWLGVSGVWLPGLRTIAAHCGVSHLDRGRERGTADEGWCGQGDTCGAARGWRISPGVCAGLLLGFVCYAPTVMLWESCRLRHGGVGWPESEAGMVRVRFCRVIRTPGNDVVVADDGQSSGDRRFAFFVVAMSAHLGAEEIDDR